MDKIFPAVIHQARTAHIHCYSLSFSLALLPCVFFRFKYPLVWKVKTCSLTTGNELHRNWFTIYNIPCKTCEHHIQIIKEIFQIIFQVYIRMYDINTFFFVLLKCQFAVYVLKLIYFFVFVSHFSFALMTTEYYFVHILKLPAYIILNFFKSQISSADF